MAESGSIVSYEDDKVIIDGRDFDSSPIEKLRQKIIDNNYLESDKFDKYHLEYISGSYTLLLSVEPNDIGDREEGADSIKAYLWDDSFKSEIKLKRKGLTELIGNIEYSIIKNNISDYIVSIDIYNDNSGKVVFENEIYNSSITVSEEFLKDSIISAVSSGTQEKTCVETDAPPNYFKVKTLDITANNKSKCYQCGNQNCENAISLVSSLSPLFICCQCYQSFLDDYTNFSKNEILINTI